ncbi:hypothetical protein [Actinoplanes sp. NPDC051859]|uniref:hypothetical protein n=1 Tax=Actinoplanes sp. NPDC051859 TaxID=3363909 RepID=UPI0037A905AA
MARGIFGKLASAAGLVTAAAVLGTGIGSAAHAAPLPHREESPAATTKATLPTTLQIAGTDSPEIVVQQADRPDLFQRMLSEVNWLSAAEPTTNKPGSDKLGPKYTITVIAKDKPTQQYDLYPLAAGGPRAYRPEKQPNGTASAGWFYGRLTMSESLRLTGAPLKPKPDVVTGGIGGGIGEEVDRKELDPVAIGNEIAGDMRNLFLINAAVLVVVLIGLGGVAFLVRRRI